MKRCLAAVCACLMLGLLLAGCSVDREADMAQTVAVVGDRVITKQELYDEVENYYLSSGYPIDLTSETLDADTRAQVDETLVAYLEYMVQEEVAVRVVDAQMPLTDEETQEIEDSVQETVATVQETYLQYDPENPDAYDGDIDADTEEFFEMYMGMGIDAYQEVLLRQAKLEKLYDASIEGVVAEESEVQALYEEKLQEQKDAASSSETEYETLTAGDSGSVGTFVMHKAQNYRMVTHILLSFTDEQLDEIEPYADIVDEKQELLDDLEEQLSEAQNEALTAESELETAKEGDDEALIAEKQAAYDEAQAAVDDLKAQVTEATAEVQTASTAFLTKRTEVAQELIEKANGIIKEAEAGTSFEELQEKYNEDEGITTQPYSLYGYLIPPTGTGFDESFADAALQMNEVGALSDPVVSDFGVHIIKLLYGTEAADLPFETVKPLLQEEADATAQQSAWEEKMDEYEKEYNVKVYENRVAWVSLPVKATPAPTPTATVTPSASPEAETSGE